MLVYYTDLGLNISCCDQDSTKAYFQFCNNQFCKCSDCLMKLEDDLDWGGLLKKIDLPTGRTLILFKEQ